MSRVAGSKRKAASVQGDEAQNETFVGDGEDMLVTAIDREIEREIADIKAGRHPHIQQSVEALEKARQKKIDASDRHRKMQIRNIEALYEYEVEDATALYNKAYLEVQEELIAELSSERNRQRMVLMEQEKSRQKKLAAANGTAATTASATATTAGGRSLRSSAPAGDGAENGTSGNAYSRDYQYGRSGGAANGVTGAGANASSSSSGGARKRTTASAPSLDFLLPENSMRADFLEIVRDLHSRAATLEKTKSKAPQQEVKVSGDQSELYIGEEVYTTGDLVVVFSTLSQENITGIVTALSHRELVVRTGTGSRFSVLVGQLRTGRVSLSKDREMMQNAVIFKTAADMQAVQDKYYK